MSVIDLLDAFAELEAAQADYLDAAAYWDSTMDEVFADPRIKSQLMATGEAYRFALIRTPVTVRADRCEISTIKVPGNEAATERVTEVWDANEMSLHYPILIETTFKYGDAYVMLWRIDDDEPDIDTDDELFASGVEITTRNPLNTRVLYDPQNERRKRLAITRWQIRTDDGQSWIWRVDLYYAEHVEHWVQLPGQGTESAANWQPYEEGDDEGELTMPSIELHGHDEIPFYHHRTGIPYGTSVMAPGYGAQDALTKMLVTQLTTTDSQGFPQRYRLLSADAALDDNTDSPDWVDDTQASSSTPGGLDAKGGQTGNERTGPGTVALYTGTDEVGQFEAADPKVFLDPAEFYIRLMAQLTTTPLHYFDPTGDAPSGESLKTAEAPLINSINWLQLLQASTVREEWIATLALLGVRVDDVEVRWRSAATVAGLDDWQIVGMKIQNGVPTDQALVEMGYEPEQVAAWLDATAEAATLAQRVALLGQIATAMQAIGASVALGVVDEAAAQAVVGQVLGQLQASGQGTEPA